MRNLSAIFNLPYLLCFLSFSCQSPSSYDTMKSYVDEIKVIDTHSHQGMPWKEKHNLFDVGMYMHTDLISAGMSEYSEEMEELHDPEQYWEYTKDYLKYCRTTSYYTQFIYNYQQLYGHEGMELSKEDFLKYSAEMDDHFNDYTEWLDKTYQDENIDFIFADRVWQPFDTNFEQPYFKYVFRIDELVLDAVPSVMKKAVVNEEALALLSVENISITDLDSYLRYIDQVIKKVVESGAVSFKVGLAYHRSLDIEIVNKETAERLFVQPTITDEDKKVIQDYIVNYLMEQSIRYTLPVQIHTGYLHGNNGLQDRGHPMKLLKLIHHYKNVKFVLFHGGYPWTGDFIILAKNRPNVYIDIVWMAQLSRTAATRTLHEILDAIPYNKICWGTDVGYIDDAVGALELNREVVATVLSERLDRGWINREIAEDIATRIFRKNAIDIFNL